MFAAAATAAQPRLSLRFDDAAGPGVIPMGRLGEALAPVEPLIRWEGAGPSRSRRVAQGRWAVELGPAGLHATVTSKPKGRFGEFVFQIDVRNDSQGPIAGALLPPFTRWRDTAGSVRASTPAHWFLTSSRLQAGGFGTLRSWTPGREFRGDSFATVPALHGYLAAVLLETNPADEARAGVAPGERRTYELHIDAGTGGRNDALRETYRVRGGYRVDPAGYSFAAYQDPDLAWASDVLATSLNWAWDETNLDPETGLYRLLDSLKAARRRFGGYDAYIWWPFWPRAGFDARFQFDHYRDMPGGLAGLREQIRKAHELGIRTFISYCHWSESDRDASPEAMRQSYREFAEVACSTEADGALMDLMSNTPRDILDLAWQCGRKLVPYNEGDPTWTDTQTNLIGRIHNDLPMPQFNLKKCMLPHHAQLRVCEPGNRGRRMRNDFVLSFFNGHGVEINTMLPDDNPDTRPDWPILARALDLLRTHRAAFRSPDWEPLVASEDPAVWINRWPAASKRLYTLCGTSPGGHYGPLVAVPHEDDVHYVDLWRYRPLAAERRGSSDLISYDIEGFTPGLGGRLGTADDSPGCIGAFRRRLDVNLEFETLHIQVPRAQADEVVEVWLDTVRPDVDPVRLPAAEEVSLDLYRRFGRQTNEAVIVRLLDAKGQAEDVAVLPEEPVRFFRVDRPARTAPVVAGRPPTEMIRIPGGRFRYVLKNPPPDKQFPYAYPPFQATYAYLPGGQPVDRVVELRQFWIDRYPVTNAQFARFVEASGYRPKDSANFLKHFVNGKPPAGLENHPVVYVSYDDAKAYATWTGKRLPTEEEWQFAAGGADGRDWPWGNQWQPARANAGGKGTEPVDAHPSGASPYGVRDLVGNVWQWTASLMDNGRHLTVMLRGGSWYHPPKGRWWVPGGPRRVNENYPLPLAGPAMNRLATVGFRCAKDE